MFLRLDELPSLKIGKDRIEDPHSILYQLSRTITDDVPILISYHP